MGHSLRSRARALTAAAVTMLLVSVIAPVGADAAPAIGIGGPRVRSDLRLRLEREPGRPQEVLVVLRRGADDTIARQVAGSVDVELGPDGSYDVLPAFPARLSRSEIAELAEDPRVDHVSHNGTVRASLSTARHWFGADAAHDAGYTGGDGVASYGPTDAVIAIADTGIDDDNPALAGKVIAFVDCTSGHCSTDGADDPNGHGTHVAGIAAGAGGDPALHGAAPGAALVGIRTLGADGVGSFASVIAGIDWAAAHQTAPESIDVLNLSLAVPCLSTTSSCWDIAEAADNAVADGLTIVAAAGNAGPARGSVEVPGAASGPITVGAMADVRPGDGASPNAGFHVADFSGRGPTFDGRVKPDVMAPGVAVRAACSHDAPASVDTPTCASARVHSVVLGGTSMASAFVAGAAALMKAANPRLTPSEIRAHLTSTAIPWGRDETAAPGHQSNDYGAGRLDVAAAMARVGAVAPVPPAAPQHASVSGSVGGAGATACYELSTDGDLPLVATVLEPDGGKSNNLRVRILNASGLVVAASAEPAANATDEFRQDLVATEVASGTYRISVEVVTGTSPYDLDVSNAADFTPCSPRVLAFSVADASANPATATAGFTNGDVAYSVVPDAANLSASWMVTTSDVRPAANDSRWQPMGQQTDDVSDHGDGILKLYPWLRNAAGMVSSVDDAVARATTIHVDTVSPTAPTVTITDDDGYVRAREQHDVTWTGVTDANLGSTPVALELVGGAAPVPLGGGRPANGTAAVTIPDDQEIAEGRVRATVTDRAGNRAAGVSSKLYVMRLGGYWLSAFGRVNRIGELPPVTNAPLFGGRVARGLAMLPGVEGGYLLDALGGVHRLQVTGGSLPPALSGGPYFGWDIARDIAVLPDGTGAYVLDGFGGVHHVGTAPPVSGTPYFGFDIAKRIVLSPTASGGGYVLDGYGGIHPFRAAGDPHPPRLTTGPYFGFDIARGLAVRPGPTPSSAVGYLLDGYGGVHPVAFGGADLPAPAGGGPYWNGWDITRGLALLPDGSGGYVVDGYGGGHNWRVQGFTVPVLPSTGYTGGDVAVTLAVR